MTALAGLLTQLLHLALMFAAAPVLVGLLRWFKARLLGRRGPPVLRPWRDIVRLARKQPLIAENASFVFRAAPAAGFASIAVSAALVPSFALGMSSAPFSDLIVLAGLLALARCIFGLAAMDIGTSFGGIGASRTMNVAVFAEPALLMVFFSLALLTGTTNLDAIVVRDCAPGLRVSLGLAAIATIAVGLAENGRIPVDTPAVFPELAMVQDAMALEYAGRDLALIEFAAALKLLLWLSLVAALYAPLGVAMPGLDPIGWVVGMLAWTGKVLALAVALTVLEIVFARMRIFRVPEFLGVALLLGLLAALFLFVSTGIV